MFKMLFEGGIPILTSIEFGFESYLLFARMELGVVRLYLVPPRSGVSLYQCRSHSSILVNYSVLVWPLWSVQRKTNPFSLVFTCFFFLVHGQNDE